MARDDDMAYLRSAVLRYLDGARPSTTRRWVNLAAPVVIQAAAGAEHWAAGRRQRAWPSGQALLASGWWRGALARKRRPRPRCKRTSGSKLTWCASLASRPRLPPGRKQPRPAGYSGSSAGTALFPR